MTATFTLVRADFEAWCDDMGYDRRRGSSGAYIDRTTAIRWETWCAAKGYGS